MIRVASEDETISQFFKLFTHFCLEFVLKNLYTLGSRYALADTTGCPHYEVIRTMSKLMTA